MDTIKQVWQRIEAAGQLHASPTSPPQFAPGATEDEIHQLENLLEIALPQDFQASYRLHNGGFTMELVTEMDMLRLDQIAEWWRILRDLLTDEGWANQEPYYFSEEVVKRGGWNVGPVQPVWWHRKWVPIAYEYAGNLTCLDLAPAPGGTVGQIIDWDHECGPSRVLFPGFQQLLEVFADQLQVATNEQAV